MIVRVLKIWKGYMTRQWGNTTFSLFCSMNQTIRIQQKEQSTLNQYLHRASNNGLTKEKFLPNLYTQ